MEDVTPQNDFLRQKRNALRDFELEMRRGPDAMTSPQKRISDHIDKVLEGILNDLKKTDDPEKVASVALSGLSKIDSERFIIENLLEELKRGEELGQTIDRFHSLGLINPLSESEQPDLADPPQNDGGFLLGLRRMLLRCDLSLKRVLINAVKNIPKFVEVKPIVGFAGMIPTVSFQFEVVGVTVYDLIEKFIDNI